MCVKILVYFKIKNVLLLFCCFIDCLTQNPAHVNIRSHIQVTVYNIMNRLINSY